MSTLDTTPGVEMIGGSLGHGLGQGVGQALGLRLDGSAARVFVELSDGEMQEGSTWEAAMSASHFRLDNLVALDRLQRHPGRRRRSCSTWSRSPTNGAPSAGRRQRDRRQRHGGDRRRADGGARSRNGKPKAIVLRTLPGKGVPTHRDAARSRISSASTSREWDGIIAEFEQSVGARPMSDARHARWPWARTRRPAAAGASVEAPFGQALAQLGADAAGDRRPDRRSRQVHRHPSVPRRLPRPLLQCRHGRAESRRGRGRPGAHRQDALRHHLRRLRHATRLRLRRHRLRAFATST